MVKKHCFQTLEETRGIDLILPLLPIKNWLTCSLVLGKSAKDVRLKISNSRLWFVVWNIYWLKYKTIQIKHTTALYLKHKDWNNKVKHSAREREKERQRDRQTLPVRGFLQGWSQKIKLYSKIKNYYWGAALLANHNLPIIFKCNGRSYDLML